MGFIRRSYYRSYGHYKRTRRRREVYAARYAAEQARTPEQQRARARGVLVIIGLGIVAGLIMSAFDGGFNSHAAGSSTTTSPGIPPAALRGAPATARAADPAAILRQAGASVYTLPRDHVLGMAAGTFPGNETVYANAYTARADYSTEVSTDVSMADSGNVFIVIPGKLTVIWLQNQTIDTSTWGGPTPAQVAKRVHGQVIT